MMGWERGIAFGALLAAAACLWSPDARAGRLDSVRSEVSGRSDSDGDDSSSFGSSSDDDDDYDDDYGGSCCTGSDGISRRPAAPMRFRGYPYENAGQGFMFQAPAEDDEDADEGRRISGRVFAEGAWQGRGLWRSAGGFRADGQIFGVDGDLSYYLEPEADDALYLGTVNLDLVPIHAPRGLFRIGGGLNTMIDGRLPGQGRREYALGWNVTTSVDLFPVFPVVVSGRADLGKLHEAWMGRVRGSVGVMMGRMEILGGYEHTQVGRVGMGGPLVGLRLWM